MQAQDDKITTGPPTQGTSSQLVDHQQPHSPETLNAAEESMPLSGTDEQASQPEDFASKSVTASDQNVTEETKGKQTRQELFHN